MSASGRTTGAARRRAVAGLALIAILCVPLVQGRIDALTRADSLDPDFLYFGSPEVLRKMALGYDGLLADVYWVRAIQYYGRRDEAERRAIRYKNLAALLEITTTLDPLRLDVYRFGSIFLAEPEPAGAGEPEKAITLLDKGIQRMPEDWRLRLDKGFVYFWYLRDYRKAGEIWLEAVLLPDAPFWMEGLAASTLSRGGAIETARMLWERQYRESTREDVRDNARNHLMSIQVDEDIWTLEFLLEKHRARHGSLPSSLEGLVAAGTLRQVPRDPSGFPYRYDPASGNVSLHPESRVRYLQLPYSYRESFLEMLEARLGGR